MVNHCPTLKLFLLCQLAIDITKIGGCKIITASFFYVNFVQFENWSFSPGNMRIKPNQEKSMGFKVDAGYINFV